MISKTGITLLTIIAVALLGCIVTVPSDDEMISAAGRQITGTTWAGPVAASLLLVHCEYCLFYKELYVGGQLVATGYLGQVHLNS